MIRRLLVNSTTLPLALYINQFECILFSIELQMTKSFQISVYFPLDSFVSPFRLYKNENDEKDTNRHRPLEGRQAGGGGRRRREEEEKRSSDQRPGR